MSHSEHMNNAQVGWLDGTSRQDLAFSPAHATPWCTLVLRYSLHTKYSMNMAQKIHFHNPADRQTVQFYMTHLCIGATLCMQGEVKALYTIQAATHRLHLAPPRPVHHVHHQKTWAKRCDKNWLLQRPTGLSREGLIGIVHWPVE